MERDMNRVLVVGSMALDTVETPFGRADDIIGGAGVYASTSASYFSPVDLVGVVGDDYPPEGLSFLQARGVDIAGVQVIAGGRSFRWAGRYEHDMSSAETLDTQLGVFAGFAPLLPDGYRSAKYVFLANITPSVQLSVLDQVAEPDFVMADTMNFWITGARADLLRVLSRVNMVLLNDAEIRQLTGTPNLAKASQEVLRMGPSYVMVKKGEYGATLVSSDFSFNLPCYPLPDVVDPTGAGDTFAGGFIGYLARAGVTDETHMRHATAIATVMASRCVEQFGLTGLAATTREDISRRYAALRSMVELEALPPGLARP
jgi:sugar/nucleoside kinase (ribokinase family)